MMISPPGLEPAPVDWQSRRLWNLWDMQRFFASQLLEVLNLLHKVESASSNPDDFFSPLTRSNRNYVAGQVAKLMEQLQQLDLPTSRAKADQIWHVVSAEPDQITKKPSALSYLLRDYIPQLRERIEHELAGRAVYYIPAKVELLRDDKPAFGDRVDEMFPSARYDISESGKCLALGRSTACVMHLMRALEIGLACMADALSITLGTENWNTILNDIENEIRRRTRATHGDNWKDIDEPFFTGAATHFRFIKNAWRNHATHAHEKYTDDEAERIYQSVRAFMIDLSARLCERDSSRGPLH